MSEHGHEAGTVRWFTPTTDARDAWVAWVTERPACVRKVAERFPPWTLWRLDMLDGQGKPTGPSCSSSSRGPSRPMCARRWRPR